jgi:hypothetical protein
MKDANQDLSLTPIQMSVFNIFQARTWGILLRTKKWAGGQVDMDLGHISVDENWLISPKITGLVHGS